MHWSDKYEKEHEWGSLLFQCRKVNHSVDFLIQFTKNPNDKEKASMKNWFANLLMGSVENLDEMKRKNELREKLFIQDKKDVVLDRDLAIEIVKKMYSRELPFGWICEIKERY
jgi:predicted membrane chloride channel (bestrophin family)